MTDAYVLDGWRTPRGRGTAKGSLARVPPLTLVTSLLDRLRTTVTPDAVEDIVLGCATQSGEQGANIARTALRFRHRCRRARLGTHPLG